METEKRAKLFRTGRSQAVRLPKEFRFAGTEVRIRRSGNSVVLEPVEHVDDWAWVDAWRTKFGGFDEDFEHAVEEDVPQPLERPEVDGFFADALSAGYQRCHSLPGWEESEDCERGAQARDEGSVPVLAGGARAFLRGL